jgi:hypothetical protein
LYTILKFFLNIIHLNFFVYNIEINMGVFGNILGNALGQAGGQFFGGDAGRQTGGSIGGTLGNFLPFKKGGKVVMVSKKDAYKNVIHRSMGGPIPKMKAAKRK